MMMFMTRVITNNVRADREDGLVADAAGRLVAEPAAPMNAVIVCMRLNGLNVSLGVPPAAISTIIVSPIARLMPRTKAAMIPERPAGTTTRVEISYFVAPRAAAPARKDCGTAYMASSEMDATVGRIMMPMTRPADSALNTWGGVPNSQFSRSSGVMNVRAKNP
jgi:hypothetical protein